MRLYEIADRYSFLLNDLYDHETGVVNEATLARLNDLSDSMETKAINITMLFKELEATADAIEKERQAMQKREKALKNQIASLKDYLRSNMERCEINKIECPQFVIALQKNPCSVEITNEDEVPKEYTKVSIDLDIAKIKDELKNGVVIPGARLVQGSSVRIR
jgi:hypothetical protein